jgi:hypothetical protein
MKDFNLIATLISIDECKLTKNVFCLRENKDRYLPFTREIEKDLIISSRKITFAQEESNDDHYKYDCTHRLQLTFDKKSKNSIKEYSFDINSQICDVLLEHRNARDISELHFCITFDDCLNDEKHLILKNSSINETIVSYSDQAEKEVRHHFI